jgi:Nucleoside 2-deoxyribosyltransferase
MTDRAYVAAALFTPAQIRVNNRIAAIVRNVGMEPVLPSEMSAEVWKGRAPKDCTREERRQVVSLNITGMLTSRIMIARVSGDTKEVDTGVAWEMGYFRALLSAVQMTDGRPRIPIAYIEPSDRVQSLNLMLAETVHAAVYGDAQLHALLSAVQNCHDDMSALSTVLGAYTPDKIIKHEREPIGQDFDLPRRERATGPGHRVSKPKFDVLESREDPGVPAHPSEDRS